MQSTSLESDLLRGRITIDWAQGIIANRNRHIRVSRTELRLLRVFVQALGRTVSRSDLVTRVWPRPGNRSREKALAVHIFSSDVCGEVGRWCARQTESEDYGLTFRSD